MKYFLKNIKTNFNSIDFKKPIKNTGLLSVFVLIASVMMPARFRGPYIATTALFFCVLFLIFSLGNIFFGPEKFKRSIKKTIATYKGLAKFQRLYVNYCVLMAASSLLLVSGAQLFASIYNWMSTALIILIVTYDGTRFYKFLSGNPIGKAILGLAFIASTNLAYSLAGQEIANITHATPTTFIHSTLFMAIMMIPILMVFAGGVIFAAGIVLSSVMMVPVMFGDFGRKINEILFANIIPSSRLKFALLTRIFQIVFYMSIGFSVYSLGGVFLRNYNSEVSKIAPKLIYNLDMYSSRECHITGTSKLASLGDSMFVVAHNDGKNITFDDPVKCEQIPGRSVKY